MPIIAAAGIGKPECGRCSTLLRRLSSAACPGLGELRLARLRLQPPQQPVETPLEAASARTADRSRRSPAPAAPTGRPPPRSKHRPPRSPESGARCRRAGSRAPPPPTACSRPARSSRRWTICSVVQSWTWNTFQAVAALRREAGEMDRARQAPAPSARPRARSRCWAHAAPNRNRRNAPARSRKPTGAPPKSSAGLNSSAGAARRLRMPRKPGGAEQPHHVLDLAPIDDVRARLARSGDQNATAGQRVGREPCRPC